MSTAENLPSQVADWLAPQAVRLGRELAVTRVEPHPDCTAYCWTSAEAALGSMDTKDLLAGNVPLILDREDQLWMAGTARPLEYYIADFRGPRRLVKLVAAGRA